ncbi:MAG TPA: hypothetical protein VKZ58_00035 [Longimicrobiales bacterium]|nr:hypothetical protein [Longimicrobiales bacterium]
MAAFAAQLPCRVEHVHVHVHEYDCNFAAGQADRSCGKVPLTVGPLCRVEVVHVDAYTYGYGWVLLLAVAQPTLIDSGGEGAGGRLGPRGWSS